MYLLRKIRDEVHRFSIEFHRKKRNKTLYDSLLTNIKGLGQKRIKLIWKNYNSLKQLSRDSIKSINQNTKIPIEIIKVMKNELNKIKKNNE